MPQTRFAQTVCHFSHNADFDQLRISKYPANAHEINYFSMLVVGSFKHTSLYSIDAGNLEFWFIAVNGANGNDSVKKMKHSILSHIDTLP